MDRKQEIIQKLRETDGYLSGQQLSEMLGVSRTAVWKTIGKLKEEGYQIEAVTNKGYRLLSMGEQDILNKVELESFLKTGWAGHPLIYKEVTGSSNNDIFALSEQGYPQGTLVVASRQTAGKGRRGRVWLSPPDVNVYMSILLKPQIRVEAAPMLTLVMALAIYQASEELFGGDASCRFGIKWPNDIVVSVNGDPYKKLCGILTEMRMEDTEIRDIVIGDGLNVNQMEFPEEIRETATSYKLALGRTVNRAALTGKVWQYFEQDYDRFIGAGGFAPLKQTYEKGLVNLNRRVRVLDPRNPFMGTAKGVTENGELIVAPDDGSSDRIIGTGEVSVRGVEGYI